jgi:hypothetical protein
MMTDYSVSRRFPRIRSEVPIRVRIIGAQSDVEYGETNVIGLGGLSFLSASPFGYRSLVEITIPLEGGMVSADGRVVYENRKSGKEWEVGIEFLRISERHRRVIAALMET